MKKRLLVIMQFLVVLCMAATADVINVSPATNLQVAIDAAKSGDVIMLETGDYYVPSEEGAPSSINIRKDITITSGAQRANIRGFFRIYDGASLTVSHLTIDGSNNVLLDQIFNYKLDQAPEGTAFGPLTVDDCIIKGNTLNTKGLIYLNINSVVESIHINNSIVHDIHCSGGDFIDSRKGLPKEVKLTNSTFYDVAQRDFIRIDDQSSAFPGEDAPKVTVDHCTLIGVGGDITYRLMYIRFVGNSIVFTNNFSAYTGYRRGFTNQQNTDSNPTLGNNYYYCCTNLVTPEENADANIRWFDENGTVMNVSPFLYSDYPPLNQDSPYFNLSDESSVSQANAGDPRWLSLNVLTSLNLSKADVMPAHNVCYTLSGQRLSQPLRKGIYIVRSDEGRLHGKNGCKVVIKK